MVRLKLTWYRPSGVPAAAVTVTCLLARRPPPSVADPCAGLTVRPLSAWAVQVTFWLVLEALASSSVELPEAPGCNTRLLGSSEASTGCSPRWYDGGASCGAVPQVLGLVPIVQSSVAPAASVENGTYSVWYGLPLSFRFCT